MEVGQNGKTGRRVLHLKYMVKDLSQEGVTVQILPQYVEECVMERKLKSKNAKVKS